MKTLRHFALSLGLVGAGALQVANAAPPATKLITTSLVDPGSAWTYYNGQPNPTVHTPGIAAWAQSPPEITALARSLGADRISSVVPQPVGTMSADQYAQNVFNYVRNNIETEFRFGLGKGARGALIDQSGTSFDQAELMVKLLRQAPGITAGYRVGTITLDATQFGRWTGLVTSLDEGAQTFTVNAAAACQFLADGGIPATVNGVSSCAGQSGNLSTVVMGHAWVAVGSNLFDPSFKRNRIDDGVDIPAAMGCGTMASPTCGESIRGVMLAGAIQSTFAGATTFEELNRTALGDRLRIYALGLEAAIKANQPGAELVDIIGGIERDLSYSPSPGTNLPYPSSAQYTWSGEIPDPFRTALRMRAGVFDLTFFADEIAGRRVRLPQWSELFVDEAWTHLPENPSCATCIADTVILDVGHPYAALSGTYADASTAFLLTDASENNSSNRGIPPITVVHAWGNGAASTERHIADMQTGQPFMGAQSSCGGKVGGAPPASGLPDAGWIDLTDCENPLQPTMAAKLIHQGSSADKIVQGVTRTNITRHNSVGIVYGRVWGPTSLSFMSVGAAISSNSRTSSSAARVAAFEGSSAMWAMLEGSIFQQTGDLDRSLGVAAEFWLRGGRILDVSPSNMAAVLQALPTGANNHWPADRKGRLQEAATLGHSTIMGLTPGLGSIFYTSDSSAYALYEGAKGGAPVGIFDPTSAFTRTINESPPSWFQSNNTSVSLANGELTLTPAPDLVTGVGEFPAALGFQRTYRSTAGMSEYIRYQLVDHYWPGDHDPQPQQQSATYEYSGPDSDYSARIGGGWTHNFEVLARYGNDGASALGADSGLDAAAAIAGIFALTDAAKTVHFTNRLATMLASGWVGDRMMYNTVNVSIGATSESFHRLTDLSFNAAPRSSSRLVQSGERNPALDDYTPITFRYIRSQGDEISFNWARARAPVFNASNWTFPDGIILTFNYAHVGQDYPLPSNSNIRVYQYREILASVTNNLGRRLTFNTTPVFLPVGNPFYWDIPIYRLNSVTDETGRSAQFNVSDCAGSAFGCGTLRVTSPTGAVTKYEYAPNGASPVPAIPLKAQYQLRRIFRPSDPNNAFDTIRYDELFRVQQITDALGRPTNYYAGGVVGSELWKRGETTDPSSRSNVEVADENGNLLSSTDAIGRTTTNRYDDLNRLVLTTNPEGDQIVRTYDVRSNPRTIVRRAKPASGLADITVEDNTYVEGETVRVCSNPKTCNRVASTTNPLGQTSFVYYPATGQPLTITSPLVPLGTGMSSARTTLCYTSITPAGSTPISFLTGKIDWVNATGATRVTSFTYNVSNKYVPLTANVDPSTTLTAPGSGVSVCPTSAKSGALDLIATFTFDPVGNLSSVDGPRTDVTDTTNYWFDSMRRLTRVNAPLSAITRYTYDIDGQRRTNRRAIVPSPTDTNPANPSPSDLVASEWRTVTNDFNATGTLSSKLDPEGNLTEYAYDDLDRLTITTDPDNRRVATVYDRAGQVLCTWKGWNSTTAPTTCVWDPATYVSQNNSGPYRYSLSTYTSNGRQASVQDAGNNVTDYAYDGFDRLAFTLFAHPTTGSRCTVAAPITNSSTPSCPGGAQQTFEKSTYDNAGNRLTWLTRKGDTITWTYDALSRMRTKTVSGTPALAMTTYAYNLLIEPLTVTSPASGDIPAHSVAYDYDGAGRKLYEENLINNVPRRVSFQHTKAGDRERTTWPDAYYVHYTFDSLNRMQYAHENSTSSNELAFYNYDQLSNRNLLRFASVVPNRISYTHEPDDDLDLLTNVLNGAPMTLDYGHNASGQITGIVASDAFFLPPPPTATSTAYVPNRLNQYSSIGTDPESVYDLNGNLLSWGPTATRNTYTYDSENRLRTATVVGGPTFTYDYDALGRRLSKSNGTPATATYYLLDGHEEIAEYSGANVLLRRYIMGSTIDDRIATTEDGTTTNPPKAYYHVNHQGSVIAMTDSAGNATGCASNLNCQRISYDAYGNLGAGSVSVGQPYRYTGRRFDPETGLYYYRARYYAPSLGRFLQTDPVGYNDDVNLYAYTGNDPANHTDPSGAVVDTLLDIGFIAYDIYDLTKDPSWIGAAALGADIVGAVVPFATGFGTAVRGMSAAPELVRGGQKAQQELSQRAATREAKRQAGVPTSQQPTSQTNNRVGDKKVGRQQTFETPKPGGGTQEKSVQVSRDIRGKHAGQPQIEAGTVKPGGQVDAAGRPRIENEGKVRVDFCPSGGSTPKCP